MWHAPSNLILVGILGPENPKVPGTYRFQGFGPDDGQCYSVDDAHVLSPDADLEGGGSFFKPAEGSPCIAVMGAGGSVWVVGFYRAPVIDDESDERPVVGDPADEGGRLNHVPGDKVIRSPGGAAVILKRGGSTIVQGGAGVQVQWLKETNTLSVGAQNINELADGFKSVRGRIKVGKSDPETISTEDFSDQVGSGYTRVRVRHGHLDEDGRRQITVSKVTVQGGKTTGTVRLRETYFDDGGWIAEGQKYQWGGKGADENAVLGKVLVDMLKDLLDAIEGLKVNTSWGPSSTPIADTLARLKQIRAKYIDNGKILSDYIFLTKKPADPGKVNE